MARTFSDFGVWLLGEVGERKAALTIHRYLPFFVDIEKQWGSIPSYSLLLGHFGASGLRRMELPMRWLKEVISIVADANARQEDSDRRRIRAIVGSIANESLGARALKAYEAKLMQRVNNGQLTVRSARLALCPAASFLLTADLSGARLPRQSELDAYLAKSPGQKAAITGFVNMLNATYGLELVLNVSATQLRLARKKGLEHELSLLMREARQDKDSKHKWLSAALAYFHGLPKSAGKAIRDGQIQDDGQGGVTVTWHGQQYWIPMMTFQKMR